MRTDSPCQAWFTSGLRGSYGAGGMRFNRDTAGCGDLRPGGGSRKTGSGGVRRCRFEKPMPLVEERRVLGHDARAAGDLGWALAALEEVRGRTKRAVAGAS